MTGLIIIFLIGLALVAGGLGAALVHVRDCRKEMKRRTDLVTHTPREPQNRASAGISSGLMSLTSAFRRLFAIGLPHRWGMMASPPALVLAGIGGAAIIWLLSAILFHLPLWIWVPLTLGAFFFVPRQYLKFQQHRAEQDFLNRFPDAIDMVVRMVRAGLPVMAAIRTIGNDSPQPIGPIFLSLADQVDIGIQFEEALVQAGERVGLDDFRFFAVAVSLQNSTGGNIASTLQILSEIIRKRRAARMKAKSTTAEVRVSAMVLGSLPFVVITGLLLTSPAYLAPLITDPRGNVIIGMAIVFLGLGFFTMRALMRRAVRL
jgi:tight adherence protein B